MISKYVEQLAENTAAWKDQRIREAINYKLGRSDWTLAEVRGRGVFNKTPDGIVTFAFDGEPLIEFHPGDIVTLDAYTVKSTQNFKLLYKPKEESHARNDQESL